MTANSDGDGDEKAEEDEEDKDFEGNGSSSIGSEGQGVDVELSEPPKLVAKPISGVRLGFGDEVQKEEERVPFSLFVDNIAPMTPRRCLWEVFGRFGKVYGVFVSRKIRRASSNRFGFVRFCIKSEALEAMTKVNGMKLYNQVLRVQVPLFAQKPSLARIRSGAVGGMYLEGISSGLLPGKLRSSFAPTGSFRRSYAQVVSKESSIIKEGLEIEGKGTFPPSLNPDSDRRCLGNLSVMASSSMAGDISRGGKCPIAVFSCCTKDCGCICSNGLKAAFVNSKYIGHDSGSGVQDSNLGYDNHSGLYVKGADFDGDNLNMHTRCCRAQIHEHDALLVSHPNHQVGMNKDQLSYCNKGIQADIDGWDVLDDSGEVVNASSDACVKEQLIGRVLVPDPQAIAICSRLEESVFDYRLSRFNPIDELYCCDTVLSQNQSVDFEDPVVDVLCSRGVGIGGGIDLFASTVKLSDGGGSYSKMCNTSKEVVDQKASSDSVFSKSLAAKVSHPVVVNGSVFELVKIPSYGVVSTSSSAVYPSAVSSEVSSPAIPHEVPMAGESKSSFTKEEIRSYSKFSARIVSTTIKVRKEAGIVISDRDERIISRLSVAEMLQRNRMVLS